MVDSIFRVCKDCGENYEITADEQHFYNARGFELPKRCKNCRDKRKIFKEEQKRLAEEEKRRKEWKADEQELADLLIGTKYEQVDFSSLGMKNPKEALVIIGNGFDIMHGANSSYWDFQKTIGKNSQLRFYMETYIDMEPDELWSDLEVALGHLDYDRFLNMPVLDMWLDNFDAYNPDAQAADFFAVVETAIDPTFVIPQELNKRLVKWVKTLSVKNRLQVLDFLNGQFRVLNFNYTEFIETLYGAEHDNVCYIHGSRIPDNKGKVELILGHVLGLEDEYWNKVELKPYRTKNLYKREIMEAAIETAAREAAWYDDATIKKCSDIIANHQDFF